MKSILRVFCIILISTKGFSQDKIFYIHGKVVDEKTGAVLEKASVFCQNTTTGTISDNEGRFALRLSSGGYDLVISYTGYETQVMRVSNTTKDKDSLLVQMKEATKSLGEVAVMGSALVADGWNKYGQFFLENFIGTTANAAQCTIENKDVLNFYFYKKRNKLKVKAKEEIIIINQALGYKIRYQLDSFVNDYNTHISSYTGYPLFENLTGTADQEQVWSKNRYRTYVGSRLHFMRSWYDSTLKEEGFQVETLNAPQSDKGSLLENPYDSAVYSLDSGTVDININGSIRVSYSGQVPDKKYLMQNHFPLNAKVQVSALEMPTGFSIEENGYFFEQSEITNMGYWAWKKVAELVPYDYNPE
ncbi:MAG: carboxypeptidase-like regulatory domain-containing protein [Bacteroidota bacterium]|nr:carboxypeptidase-like regulatory domain-containing protein [Bacteroidota bacterium]